MRFNAAMVQALWYRHPNLNITFTAYTDPQGITISDPKLMRDLGIDMSDNTSSQLYIARMSRMYKWLAGGIQKTFKTREKETMIDLWKKIILSRLDYCSDLWSLNGLNLTPGIKIIKRIFTKIASLQQLSYRERLKE